MPFNASYIYIIRMDVDPAMEEEFNDVYSNEHQPDMCQVPGVISASRYKAMDYKA